MSVTAHPRAWWAGMNNARSWPVHLLSHSGQAVLSRPNAQAEPLLLPLSANRQLAGCRWEGVGRPLVLLHGLLDSAAGWDDLARSTKRPVIAFNLPGFAGSSLPTRPRISAYSEDIIDGIRQLGLDDFVLVGHSLGGAVATSVAERMADQVAVLVLMAPAGFGAIRMADFFNLPGLRQLTERGLPFFLANRLVISAVYAAAISHRQLPSPDLIQRLGTDIDGSSHGTVSAVSALAASGHSSQAFFQRSVGYSGPVWALWGIEDQLIPLAHIAGLQAALPQVAVSQWSGMGHHPQYERPDLLARYIEAACIAS